MGIKLGTFNSPVSHTIEGGKKMQVGMKHSTVTAQIRGDELTETKIRFGRTIRKLRAERKAHSLRSLGEAVGVSAKYLSEIENGIHIPQDELIYKLAKEFRISEVKLFKIAKRVPLSVRHAIEHNGELSDLVAKLVKADATTLEAVSQLLEKK
jgi:transcriptional regulator with XRE-family HTH domain